MNRDLKKTLIASLLYVSIVIAGIKMFPVEKEPNFADWDRVRDCELAVGQFADRGTDIYFEQMEQCVHLDADYLNVPFQPEGEE